MHSRDTNRYGNVLQPKKKSHFNNFNILQEKADKYTKSESSGHVAV